MLSSFSDQTGNNLGKVEAMKIIGNVYFVRKDYAKAIEYYEKAIALSEHAGADINDIVSLQGGLVELHIRNNNLKKALEIGLLLPPLIESNEINDKSKALIFKNLGNVYLSQGNLETALFYYKKNEEVYADTKKVIKVRNNKPTLCLKIKG